MKPEQRSITVYAMPQDMDNCMESLAQVFAGVALRFQLVLLDVTDDPDLDFCIDTTPTVVLDTPGFLKVIMSANSAERIRCVLGIRQG